MFSLPNTWNNIITWFQDLSDRNRLLRDFNLRAKESFIAGQVPTLLRASISRGCSDYKHEFSSWLYSGYRIQALSGRVLAKKELEALGMIILSDTNLIRRLVSLGWDTLEICGDQGRYGLRWRLLNYTQLNKLLQ
mgnify:CR=1 FL=1